jgi:hypothetical protein
MEKKNACNLLPLPLRGDSAAARSLPRLHEFRARLMEKPSATGRTPAPCVLR